MEEWWVDGPENADVDLQADAVIPFPLPPPPWLLLVLFCGPWWGEPGTCFTCVPWPDRPRNSPSNSRPWRDA